MDLINGDGDGGGVQVVKLSNCLAFGSIGGEVCRISEVFVECIGYVFVGVENVIVEGYGSVGVGGNW